MEEQLYRFIEDKAFPCIMAKALLKKGNLKVFKSSEDEISKIGPEIINSIYQFIDDYRKNSSKLHSFIIGFDHSLSFNIFEKIFWSFLKGLQALDRRKYIHDPRVGKEPLSPDFSYSLKSEAFFILMLHPDSPRLGRRFKYPAIVMNPHQQFELLRLKGVFKKVRNTIRKRDRELQGSINPMLMDFGEQSEVFQYTGKEYKSGEVDPYIKDFHEHYISKERREFQIEERIET